MFGDAEPSVVAMVSVPPTAVSTVLYPLASTLVLTAPTTVVHEVLNCGVLSPNTSWRSGGEAVQHFIPIKVVPTGVTVTVTWCCATTTPANAMSAGKVGQGSDTGV